MGVVGKAGAASAVTAPAAAQAPKSPTRTLNDALPRDKFGNPVPESSLPHSQLGKEQGRKGEYFSAREFGKDGKPVRDIHFTDHGRNGHPNPHQHKYESNPTGGTPKRGDPQPLGE
jgi:hypothetical protein